MFDKQLKALHEQRASIIAKMEDAVAKPEEFDGFKAELAGIDKQIANIQEVSRVAGNPVNIDAGEEKELGQASLSGAIIDYIINGKQTGIYAELAKDDMAKNGHMYKGGVILAEKLLKRQLQNNATATGGSNGNQGGVMVQTDKRSFIEKLREALVLRAAGAQFITGLSSNFDIPRENVVSAPTVKAETADSAITNPTFNQVAFTPKRLTDQMKFSKQLLIQASANYSIQQVLENQMLASLQRLMDRLAINGNPAATPAEPEGILNTSGIGNVPIDTNGGAPLFTHIVALETEVAIENADIGSLRYLTNAKARGKLKTTKVDNGSGIFVWGQDSNMMNGYEALTTNLVPSNLVKAAGSNLSAIIFGNFNDFLMAQFGGIELLVDPYTEAGKGLNVLTINAFFDSHPLRAASFAAIKDAVTTP